MKEIQAEINKIAKILKAKIDAKGISSDLGLLFRLGKDLKFNGEEIVYLSQKVKEIINRDEENYSINSSESLGEAIVEAKAKLSKLDKVYKKLKQRKI